MDYLKETISTYVSEAYNNKWTIVFIVFGILIAFSVGKTMAMKKEEFEEEIPLKKNDILAEAICPDLTNYLLKEDVEKNYIARNEVEKKYILKKDAAKQVVAAAPAAEEKLFLSMEDVRRNYMLKTDCLKVRDDSSSEDEDAAPEEKPPKKINLERDKKIQNYFDKNKDAMDVPYSLLNEAYCNKKTCLPNGLPEGLKPE
jgi:hypothetical protein